MADFVATAINEMLDWLDGVADPPTVGTRYITTFNGDPQGAGSENINTITGSSNRVAITANMAVASGGSAVSNGDITITASAVGSATVDYVAIYDAQTAGNLLASTAVTSKSVSPGDSLTILSGDLSFTIT